jgi:hypothetical protein
VISRAGAGLVLTAVVFALAGCGGPGPRPAAAASAASPVVSAAPSTPAPVPPDLDPTKRQHGEAVLGDKIGAPAEFQTYHSASWDGTTMQASYSFHCNGNGCTYHVVPLISAWAHKAGAKATEFTVRKLTSCIRPSCSASFTRDGFTVQLTASVTADTSAGAKPGDVLYLAGLTIRPT